MRLRRVQITKGFKPFARAAYNSEPLNVFAYWNRRDSKEPQYSLASGVELLEKSDIMHVEAQGNRRFLDNKARVVAGAVELRHARSLTGVGGHGERHLGRHPGRHGRLVDAVETEQLGRLGVVDPMMEMSSAKAGALLLLIAGVYEWTPLKRACLTACQVCGDECARHGRHHQQLDEREPALPQHGT